MDEKDFLILHHIEQERSITKASELLYTSQPALSYRIKKIEEKLGVQIFIRGSKTLEFTPEGEYIISFARKMLTRYQIFNDNLSNINSQDTGNLRIAVTNITSRYYLPQILKEFTETYPQINIDITTGTSPLVINSLEEESVHVGIIRGDYNWNEGKKLIGKEDICLISNRPIDMMKLPEMPRIAYKVNTTEMHKKSNHNENVNLMGKIQSWWNERYPISPFNKMEVESFETCKEMVRYGLGYAIIPRVFIQPEDNLYIEKLVFKNGEAITRNTWLLYRNSTLQLKYVNNFIAKFENYDE